MIKSYRLKIYANKGKVGEKFHCIKCGYINHADIVVAINLLERVTRYVGKYWTEKLTKTFRFFWLMAGYYHKWEFEEWNKKYAKPQYKLSDKDWEAFFYKKA